MPTKKLKITASTQYSTTPETEKIVPVNSGSLEFETPGAFLKLRVDIRDFSGAQAHAETSQHNPDTIGDYLTIVIQVKPKNDINGDQLLFGNDFPQPIKLFLPYGTGLAMKAFNTFVDPSVKGDLYSDTPWLYGKALSSFNIINVSKENNFDIGSKENTQLLGEELPKEASARRRYFTDQKHLSDTVLKKDLYYLLTFSTNVLSLQDNNFHIALPGGFELNLLNYLGSKAKDNSVRWVLKLDKDVPSGVEAGTPLIIVTFKLVEE